MADVLDVLTLDEGKQVLRLAGANTSDAELPEWITAVSRRLDRLVGPVVRRTVTDEKHDGGSSVVYLAQHPVSSVTSVTEYDGTTATTLTAETNASKPTSGYIVDDYSADPAYLSNAVRRRSGNADAAFPGGRKNIVATYQPGRFATTAAVDERFKRGAGLMLINLWRSQQDSTGQVGEFDVPMLSFPTFAVPRSVREMFDGEIQDPLPL